MPTPRVPGPLLVALSTLGLAVLLYPGALLRGEAFFERDLHLDWYARLAALGRALGEGAWPLWDPGLGFGQPLLADPSLQALYPVTWLALALPWGVAYTAFVLVHLFIAGLGATRVAARLGAGNAGKWTAGLVFVLSGPVQSAVNLWTHLAGTAWMPWVLLSVDTAVRRPGARSALGLAAAAAMQALAGSPDVCAMTLGLSLALAAARLVGVPRARAVWRPALTGLVAASALAAALTCAVWLPAAGAVSRSPRVALAEDVRGAWSVPLPGLVRLVAPLDPARVPFEPELWTRLYDRPGYPLLYSLYLGLPTLGLACAALSGRRRRGHVLGLAVVALLTAAFATGPHGPLYGPLCAVVPLLQMLRFPSKAMLVVSLAVSLLAGLGMRALARAASVRLAVVALVALGSGATAFFSGRIGAEPGWSPFLGVAFALLLALYGAWLRPAFARATLLAIALADLLAAHRDLNATMPASLLVEPPPVLEHVRSADGSRVYIWDYHTLPDAAERLLGHADPYRAAAGPPGLDPRVLAFAAQRQVLVPLTAGFFGVETSYDFDLRGLYPRDLNDLTFFVDRVQGTPVHTRLLRLGAVAKVIALHERGLEDLRLERRMPSLVVDPIRVFAVPNPLPRAFLVGRTRIADGAAAFSALLDPAFDPRVEAIVAEGPRLSDASNLGGSVRWLERRADRQRLETTSERTALLVLADAYDPGWRASVDGVRAPLRRANVAFRAVAVPEGRHRVELVYRPRAVVIGLAVSVAALVVAGALFVASRGSRR